MKICIVGGLGFVGVNTCVHFAKKKWMVYAVDNFSRKCGAFENRKLLDEANVNLVHVDIRVQNDVETFFRENRDFDVIINLAAQVAFKVSVENPRLDFEINALGTFNLLEAIRLYCPEAFFIYASTNQVYGSIPEIPLLEKDLRFDFRDLEFGISEKHNLDFLSPYGCSKGCGDQYTIDYARVFGLKTIVLRLGGIYGVNQWSYEDHGWVSYITRMIVMDQTFNRFGHGKQVRDILFITDILSAFDRAVEAADEVSGVVLNIAGGRSNSFSVLELMKTVEELTGNVEKSVVNEMRAGDKVVMYLDIRKAEKRLNWKPKVSGVEGIERLVKWIRSAY